MSDHHPSDVPSRLGIALRRLATCWLLFLLAFAWGVATMRHHVFPYSILKEISLFLRGGLGEQTSPLEKLASDFGGIPHRLLDQLPDVSTELQPVEIAGLRDRRDSPGIYISPDAPRGFRLITGAFDFENQMWGAVLLDPDGLPVRQWRFSESDASAAILDDRPSFNFAYGVDMTRDGSVIFSNQLVRHKGILERQDWCGRREWSYRDRFHHTVTLGDDGTFWTFGGRQDSNNPLLLKMEATTGAVIQRIELDEVRAANPWIPIFDLTNGRPPPNSLHGNDIDPLTADRAGAFPRFEVDDLLLSFRSNNLVLVLDPDDLKIKWWRVGPWDRQHDPDWEPDGRITVFSNNRYRRQRYSQIVAIEPSTMEVEVLLDGKSYDFYSAFNGMHELTPAGTRLVTSSNQGRAFEVDAQGNVVFEFLNAFSEADRLALVLSRALFIPLDYFDEDRLPDCSSPPEAISTPRDADPSTPG